MEFLISVLAATLGAAGVFASTGFIEVLAKAIRQIRMRRQLEEVDFKVYKARRSVKARTEEEHAETEDEEKMRKEFEAARDAHQEFPLNLFYAALLVGCVFAIAIGVVYTLTHIGGPLEATINATIAKAGGSILIVGGGLFAAFFAVALMAFVAIHVFSGK